MSGPELRPPPELRAPEDQVAQDWDALARYLRDHGHELTGGAPRQFAGGFGNLNYLLEMDGEAAVLRRPPTGPVPPGANDMAREHRILRGLWRGFPLAPRSLLFCDDKSVLGAPFFIMEYRPGLVIGGTMPGDLAQRTPPPGEALGETLVALLAELHRVDPAAVGLDDLGRPEGFRARTAAGWTKRAALAWDGTPPKVADEITAWLAADRPLPEQTTTLLHNDFKLDNVVLDPDSLAPRAVLDWDLGTRGDPLVDLGVLLSYWTEAGDPEAMQALQQMPTAGHGFPTREAAAARYAALTGRDLSGFAWYRVLTTFRVAVIFMQLHRRYREGGAGDARFAGFAELAEGLLEFSREVARGRVF